jgi:hypothetical protein
MEATIAEEIVKHKLAHLPVYDLVANEPPKPNITETYESINWD